MCHLLSDRVLKKRPFHQRSLPYLYIGHGRLAAPACVEAVLLNGELVANWLLLQSGLWLCPWVIRGAVKREPLEHCQWTREGMPAQCRTARENAAGDAQIPQRQRPCSTAQNSGRRSRKDRKKKERERQVLPAWEQVRAKKHKAESQ